MSAGMVEPTSTPFSRSPEVAWGRESKEGAVAGLAAAGELDFWPLPVEPEALPLLPPDLADCLPGICVDLPFSFFAFSFFFFCPRVCVCVCFNLLFT